MQGKLKIPSFVSSHEIKISCFKCPSFFWENWNSQTETEELHSKAYLARSSYITQIHIFMMMFYDVIGQFPSVKRDFLLQQIPLKLLTFFLYVQSCKVLTRKKGLFLSLFKSKTQCTSKVKEWKERQIFCLSLDLLEYPFRKKTLLFNSNDRNITKEL